jgi:hypothetical protein
MNASENIVLLGRRSTQPRKRPDSPMNLSSFLPLVSILLVAS